MAKKAHEAVMEWVTEELQSGRLHIGDHLPSERALAETLQVSRSSLREAYRVLEALGTISSATGSGPKSGTIITAEPQQALSLALSMQLATSQVEYRHVLEMRMLLERWAARHSTAERGDWGEAERLLDRMDDPDLPVETFLQLDAQFHVVCSRSADNPLVSAMMDALRLSIADHTLLRARALPDWTVTAARLRAEHRGILEAFRTGEHELAVARVSAHIQGYSDETEPAR